MKYADTGAREANPRIVILLVVLMAATWCVLAAWARASAEDAGPQAETPPVEQAATNLAERMEAAERRAEAMLAADEPKEQDAKTVVAVDPPKIKLLDLMVRGGLLMLPIAAMSLLVVMFGLERMLGLRRRKVLPPRLMKGLGSMTGRQGGFDPRRAYKLCQQYPSSAANVVRAMLLKVGRPPTEVEQAVTQAGQREAARLYSNVRWLSLAAGITPLLGLLGTVWGMIEAFFATANLPVGANKAEHLAQGIYKALVTTFAGLAVAIPAAVLAHLFEGRIQKLFRELDESLLGLLPQLERFEGRVRISREQVDPTSPPARPAAGEPGRTQPAASPK